MSIKKRVGGAGGRAQRLPPQSICRNSEWLLLLLLKKAQKQTSKKANKQKLKDRINPHVTNFFRLRLSIGKQEGKRKYKSDGAVMVGEFVCVYVCACTVSE